MEPNVTSKQVATPSASGNSSRSSGSGLWRIDSEMKHLAFVMDGNRRWADRERLPRVRGHKEGIVAIERVINSCIRQDDEYLTLFAFSTENWNREKYELRYLVRLMYRYLTLVHKGMLGTSVYNDIKLSFIGNRADFGTRNVEMMRKIELHQTSTVRCHVVVAVSYGGKDEIVDAVNAALENGKDRIKQVDIESNLYLPGVPFPDMIARTGRTMSLSFFLTWQSAYSELLFLDRLWPEISEDDVEFCVQEYKSRDRKFGK